MPLAPTPNMALQKPEPGVTLTPDWAPQLNLLLDLIDAHDHSSGKGLRVTPAGMNINADLELNGNDLTEARSVRLADNGAALAGADDLGSMFRNGDDLYYRSASGAVVRITSGGAVASSITGAFSALTPGSYPYTVTAGDAQRVLLVDTSAARTINLPAATTAVMFCIKDVTGSAFANPITLDPAGTDTIEGVNANYILRDEFEWAFVISDGVSGWHIGVIKDPVPVGSIQIYGGATAPSGYLMADGAVVSRTTYAKLFAKYGTVHGAGDGSTTFGLPDLRGRFPLGKAASGTGSSLGGSGGLIDHVHSIPKHYHGIGVGADLNIPGNFWTRPGSGFAQSLSLVGGAQDGTIVINQGNIAGRIGTVTGGVDGNADMTSGAQNPPFLSLNFIIKAF